MPVLAGSFAGREELHVDVEAALLGVHLLVDDPLDQAVGRTLERHLARLHDVEPAVILLAEFLRGLQRLGIEVHRFGLCVGALAFARVKNTAH
jgi:hypothetical protein